MFIHLLAYMQIVGARKEAWGIRTHRSMLLLKNFD
jgi:hypothetical protein